jgi:hypothetical protein
MGWRGRGREQGGERARERRSEVVDGWMERGREGGEYEGEGRNEVHIGKIQDKTLFLLPSTIAFALFMA